MSVKRQIVRSALFVAISKKFAHYEYWIVDCLSWFIFTTENNILMQKNLDAIDQAVKAIASDVQGVCLSMLFFGVIVGDKNGFFRKYL